MLEENTREKIVDHQETRESAREDSDTVTAQVNEVTRRFRQCFGTVRGLRCTTQIDITHDRSRAFCKKCRPQKKAEGNNPYLSTAQTVTPILIEESEE